MFPRGDVPTSTSHDIWPLLQHPIGTLFSGFFVLCFAKNNKDYESSSPKEGKTLNHITYSVIFTGTIVDFL